MYDPHKAPLLDHYRLKVPAVRSVLEYCTFLILFILFVIVLENNDVDVLTTSEIVFMVYGFGAFDPTVIASMLMRRRIFAREARYYAGARSARFVASSRVFVDLMHSQVYVTGTWVRSDRSSPPR